MSLRLLAPVAAVVGAAGAYAVCAVLVERRRPRTVALPLDRLVRDLRRLEAELAALTATRGPVSLTRVRGVSLAYDDTLKACCAALGLPEPQTPLSPVERLATEAALQEVGLSW